MGTAGRVAGFFRRLFGGEPSHSPDRADAPGVRTAAPVAGGPGPPLPTLPTLRLAGDALDRFGFEVVGESYRQEALREIIAGAQRDLRGGYRLETVAALVPEPSNPVDANAVAVSIAGMLVGYVPREAAAYIQEPLAEIIGRGRLPTCGAVVVGGYDRESLGVWLDLDDAIVELTPEIEAAQAAQRRASVKPFTGDSTSRRPDSGQHNGRHYTGWVEDVKALKRHSAYTEARDLLQALIEAVELEATAEQAEPPPWYYEQLAIVCRKLADYDAEVLVLERYIGFATAVGGPGPRPEMQARLVKAVALRDRKQRV